MDKSFRILLSVRGIKCFTFQKNLENYIDASRNFWKICEMSTKSYYLTKYIAALESDKVDGKLFANLADQRSFFHKKCMEQIDWDLINRAELARRTQIEATKLQDIMRGKAKAEPREFRAIQKTLEAALA